MVRYVLSLVFSIALVIIASMMVVQAVDAFVSTDDAIIASLVVAVIAAFVITAVVVMHDGWRCRLVLETNVRRSHMVSMG